jgi:hypothetical protein
MREGIARAKTAGMTISPSISAGLSFGGLEQSVDSFNEAVGLARSGPGDECGKMAVDRSADLPHGLDLGAPEFERH